MRGTNFLLSLARLIHGDAGMIVGWSHPLGHAGSHRLRHAGIKENHRENDGPKTLHWMLLYLYPKAIPISIDISGECRRFVIELLFPSEKMLHDFGSHSLRNNSIRPAKQSGPALINRVPLFPSCMP